MPENIVIYAASPVDGTLRGSSELLAAADLAVALLPSPHVVKCRDGRADTIPVTVGEQVTVAELRYDPDFRLLTIQGRCGFTQLELPEDTARAIAVALGVPLKVMTPGP